MSHSVFSSRRNVIKALATVTTLPLTASFARAADAESGPPFGRRDPLEALNYDDKRSAAVGYLAIARRVRG